MTDAAVAYAYVSCSQGNAVEVLALDRKTGALARATTVPLSGDGMPLALSRDGRFLYAAVFSRDRDTPQPRYESFAVRDDGGRLERLGVVDAPGRMSFITVDRSGRFLLGASVANDLISIHAIDQSGRVGEAPLLVNSVRSKAHQFTTDPSNRFAFVPNLGAGIVQQFRFDAADARLTENDPPHFALHGDVGPRHMAYHPNGRFAYVLCEFDGAVVACELDADNGTLNAIQTSSILPGNHAGEAWGAQIHASADGRFVFTSDRASSTIGAYVIDDATGFLTKTANFATETCPRGFDVSEDGKWLVVAGEKSNYVSSYAITPESGKLDLCDRIAVTEGPLWVEMRKA